MLLVSKKKYNELEAKYRELKRNQQEKLYESFIDGKTYVIMGDVVLKLQKQIQSMQCEIAHYKQMYADEVQKRIEMAELIKNQ